MNLDHESALRQIGTGNLLAIGARDMTQTDTSLTMRVGSKRTRIETLVITLDPSDTYSVRRVVVSRRTYSVVEDVTESGVTVESLGATVRRLGDR